MKKVNKYIALLTLALLLSACSIFKKGCNCPKFYTPIQANPSVKN